MRDVVLVEKRVVVSLWRSVIGECYRLCGLMIGLVKFILVKCYYEFVEVICCFQDDFIKFFFIRVEIGRKIEGFFEKSKFSNVVVAIDGSYIFIKVFKENYEDYFNWKYVYSYLV